MICQRKKVIYKHQQDQVSDVCVCDQLLSHDRLFCDPMDCSQPGSSVHGISQARVLEWAAISSSRGLLDPVVELTSPVSPALGGGFLTCSLRVVPVTSLLTWSFRTGSWMGTEVRKLKVDPTLIPYPSAGSAPATFPGVSQFVLGKKRWLSDETGPLSVKNCVLSFSKLL